MVRQDASTTDLGQQLFDAAIAGDRQRLKGLCAPLGEAAQRQLLPQLAQQLMRPGLWPGAVTSLSMLETLTPEQAVQLRLARNMACLQEYRPVVHALLFATPGSPNYTLAPSAEGTLTVVYRGASGSLTSMSPDNAPAKGVEQIRSRIAAEYATGKAMTLCGIGDGYLLGWMAESPPALFQDRQQAVYVIESDPRAVITALMVHDFTGETGPIRAARFQWLVGPEWGKQLLNLLTARPGLPLPQITIRLGLTGEEIEKGLLESVLPLDSLRSRVLNELERDYASHTADYLASLFSANPPRQPRAMLVTTRFTHTLKYSNADLEEALRSYGWEVLTIAEPADHELVTNRLVQSEIQRFRPDIVFQINHHRQEYPDAVPCQVPWVCWIQDHQVQLTSGQVGKQIGERDFVLTGARYRYVKNFGYPDGQCIDLCKLTRGDAYGQGVSNGCDLAYVSHWSVRPREVLADILERFAGAHEQTRIVPAFRCCGEQMIRQYEEGQSLKTPYDVRDLVRRTLASAGLDANTPESEDFITKALFERLNNPLYRQQALTWAAELAEEMGLSLGIYGDGWETHPTLGKYAKGRVQYGQALAQVTRGTKLNLLVEPYPCLSHQRMLDGLAAGGFFLVRDHPFSRYPQRIAGFLNSRGIPRTLQTLQDVREALRPEDRREFEQLLHHVGPLTELGDAIWVIRCWQNGELLANGNVFLPHLDDIGFDTKLKLRQRIERFLDDEASRREIAKDQFNFVSGRLTYVAAFRRVVAEIGRRIAEIGDTGISLAKGCYDYQQWQQRSATLEREERWEELADYLGHIAYREENVTSRQRLARNLAAFKVHHGGIYERIRSADTEAYQITVAESCAKTVCKLEASGKSTCLTPGGDPNESLKQWVAQLDGPAGTRESFCLAGIGDGYLVSTLACLGRRGKQPLVLVVEPDPALLRTCMMIHDYSTVAEKPHVRWITGPSWREDLADALLGNPLWKATEVTIPQGPAGAAVQEEVGRLLARWQEQQSKLKEELTRMYLCRGRDHVPASLAGEGLRRPRAILISCRPNAEQAYTTQCVREAFEQLGWDTMVPGEDEAYLEVTGQAILLATREFVPDLVVELTPLAEQDRILLPEGLPVVRWMGDGNNATGHSRFVLSEAMYPYASPSGHLCRGRIPGWRPARFRHPAAACSDGAELVCISEYSQRPEQVVGQILRQYDGDPKGRKLVENCCGRIMQLYRDHQCLPSLWDIRKIVEQAEKQTGVSCCSSEVRTRVIERLFQQLNLPLYVQQGLGWASQYARERGIRLNIYGSGWERHPTLAHYACGVVEDGEAWAELAAKAQISLQLEPRAWHTSPPLLEGSMAGGFFLMRQHPANMLPLAVLQLLKQYAPEASSVEQARKYLEKTQRRELNQLLEEFREVVELGDPVQIVREWDDAQILPDQAQILPMLGQVSFHDYPSFAGCADRFLADPEARRQIAMRQHEQAANRWTYSHLLRRVIGKVREHLAQDLKSRREAA